GGELKEESLFLERFNQLNAKALPPKEIEKILESEHPILHRLSEAGSLLKVLPGRYQSGEWFSLQALKVRLYDPLKQQIRPVPNFTLYSDEQFENIRHAYLDWEQAKIDQLPKESAIQLYQTLITELNHAYQSIAGTSYQQTK